MTPGVKTSEARSGAVAAGLTIYAAMHGTVNPTVAMIVIAVMWCVYTVSRTLAKQGRPE